MAQVTPKTLYTMASTPYSVTLCVPSARYQFTIEDSFGDGICCGWGRGSYSVTYNGMEVTSGGEYKASETTTFGWCEGEPTANLVDG